jgi:acyl dehydratase
MTEKMRDGGGRCFEDFEVGMVLPHALGRTVTAADNAWSTLLAVNTNPIHFDAHYASALWRSADTMIARAGDMLEEEQRAQT